MMNDSDNKGGATSPLAEKAIIQPPKHKAILNKEIKSLKELPKELGLKSPKLDNATDEWADIRE